MITVPAERFSKRDKDSLISFIEYCKSVSVEKGRRQIASISLAVPHIDPLAVLDSIHESNELHFFLESPYEDRAFAAMEAIIEKEFSGPDRFQEMHKYSKEVLKDCIVTGDIELPYTGVHFCCSFNFQEDAESDNEAFPPARVFIPRWQVSRSKGQYSAVANFVIDADTDVKQVCGKIWAAYEKFAGFDYDDSKVASKSTSLSADQISEVGGPWFEDAVNTVLDEIKNGAYEKLVLSRAKDVHCSSLDPFALLYNIRNNFPACYTFSMASGEGDYFLGASPERLLSVNKNMLHTSALAGSAPRGKDARSDAAYARELLKSKKNNHEHNIVLDYIVERLEQLGLEVNCANNPRLLQLSNVQHLSTPVHAAILNGIHPLDIAETLHPTPAVCGRPRKNVVKKISEIEPFSRGPYAGSIGWFDASGSGEMIVAIRSAHIDSEKIRLYAGAGVVEGSTSGEEYAETGLKFKAMLESLLKMDVS